MKKVLKKASALLVVGLVACTGRTITRQEAITTLQDIKAKQAEEGFVYATDFSFSGKLQMSAANGNSAEQTAILSYNSVQKRVKYDIRTVQDAGSESSEGTQTTWMYVSDGVIYQVQETTNAGEATKRVYEKTSTDVDNIWDGVVSNVQEQLTSNISETDNPDYFISMLNGSLNISSSNTTVTINTEHYTTTGVGNITGSLVGRVSVVSGDASSGDAPIAGDFSANFSFDNYRVIQSFLAITVDQTSAADELNHMSKLTSYSYSDIKIDLPDLAGFTEQSAS